MEARKPVDRPAPASLNSPSSTFAASTGAASAGLEPRVRRWLYALIIAAAGAQGLAAILTSTVQYSAARWPENRPPHTPLFSANDRSRWATVWSLVERKTYQIDEIIQEPGWDTIDKVRFNEHFYSSKPPLLSTVIAGLYWGVKRAFGLDLLTQTHETVHAILLIVNWVPWLAALALLALLAERYAQNDFGRLFLIVAAAWGTFLTTFLITLNNHTVAATSLVFSLTPALAITLDGRRESWRFALAGFWAAFTVCNELPACAYGAGLFLWLARHDLRRTCAVFVPAALVPLAAFFYTNYLVAGSGIPFYASFGSATHDYYRYVFEGIPSYWMRPSAVDAGESSGWVYLWHCTFGHHGIFSLSPIFLLTLAGWLVLARRHDSKLRSVSWLSLGLTAWVLAFYLKQTHSYNYGGLTSGLRWAFWLIPLWLLALVPVFDRWGQCRWVQCVAAILLGISAFSANYPQRNPWQQPWLYHLWERWHPPAAVEPDDEAPVRRSLWFNLPTDQSTNPEQYQVELRGVRGDGAPVVLQMSLAGPATADRIPVRVIQRGAIESATAFETLLLDRAAWQAGEKPATILKEPGVDDALARKSALVFLQGLPRSATWRAAAVRYLKTPLRVDAFECRVGVAAMNVRAMKDGPVLRYRRAVWWCDEIPFGVAQIEDTVTDPRDNSIVYKQRLTVSKIGH